MIAVAVIQIFTKRSWRATRLPPGFQNSEDHGQIVAAFYNDGNQGRLPTPKRWLSQAPLFFTPAELRA